MANKVRVYSEPVDGMRAFAVMHIVVGHYLLFSTAPRESRSGLQNCEGGTSDCETLSCSQPGFVNHGCVRGQCYTGIGHADCEGKSNGHELGNHSWCWDGRRDHGCCSTQADEDENSTKCSPVDRNELEGTARDVPMLTLFGGGSMGFFYIISGFVMVLGYAQTPIRFGKTCSETIFCIPAVERYCCCDCCCADETNVSAADLPVFNVPDFIRKRAARLAPMYYATNALGLLLALTLLAGDPNPLYPLWSVTVLTCLGVTSWVIAPPLNGVTWTISTMVFFYMCFPSLAPRLQRLSTSNLRSLALGMYGLQAGLMFVTGVFYFALFWVMGDPEAGAPFAYQISRTWPLLRLPIFIMGCLAGMQRIRENVAKEEQTQAVQACPIITQCAGCCCLMPADGLSLWWLFSLIPCIAFVQVDKSLHLPLRWLLEMLLPMLFYDWILAVTDPEQAQSRVVRVFASKPMLWLADISMACYMIHMLVLMAFATLVGGTYIWITPICFVISIGLGWLLTRFFEEPCAKRIRGGPRTTRSMASEPAPVVVGEPTKVEPA